MELYCDLCRRRRRIVGQEESRGFTGAPIYWTLMSCGHWDVDDSRDSLDWVR